MNGDMNNLFACQLTLHFSFSTLDADSGAYDDPLAGIENLLAPGEVREDQLETEIGRDGRWGTP